MQWRKLGKKLFRNSLITMIKNAQTKDQEGGGKTIKKKEDEKKATEGGDDEVRKRQTKGKQRKEGGKKAKDKPRLVEIAITSE